MEEREDFLSDFWDGEGSWLNRIPSERSFDCNQETLAALMTELIDHIDAKHTSPRILGIDQVMNSDDEVIDYWLSRRERDFAQIRYKFNIAVSKAFELSPRNKAEFIMRSYITLAGISAAIDCMRHEMLVRRAHFHTWVRGNTWAQMKPMEKDKKGKDTLNWILVLQHQILVTSFRYQWKLVRGVVYEPMPGTRRAIRAISRVEYENGLDIVDTIKKVVWDRVVDPIRDADLYRELQKNPELVPNACEFLLNKSTPELPHIIPTTSFMSFKNGKLLVIRGANNSMTLDIIDDVIAPLDKFCIVHHDDEIHEEMLTMPLNPCWCKVVGYKEVRTGKRDADGEEKVIQVPIHEDYEGEELLEWLKKEDAMNDMKMKDFDASKRKFEDYLIHSASVSWKVASAHSLTPQMLYLLYALIGRLFYYNREFDGWEVAPYVRGESRSGKGVFLYTMINQFLGDGAVGAADASKNDNFMFNGAEAWRVFMCQEIRPTDKLPEGFILSAIAGEDVVIRGAYKNPIKLKQCPFNVVATGNGDLPFSSLAGEVDNRFKTFVFDKSFVGKEDPTLKKRVRDQVAANALVCLRCYQNIVRALERRGINEFLPVQMRKEGDVRAWQRDFIHQFMSSDWIQYNQGLTRHEIAESSTLRSSCYHVRIADLGKAFRVWLKLTHPASGMPWEPTKYRPVFDHKGLSYHDTESPVFSTHPRESERDIEIIPPGYIFGCEIKKQYIDEMNKNSSERGSNKN